MLAENPAKGTNLSTIVSFDTSMEKGVTMLHKKVKHTIAVLCSTLFQCKYAHKFNITTANSKQNWSLQKFLLQSGIYMKGVYQFYFNFCLLFLTSETPLVSHANSDL